MHIKQIKFMPAMSASCPDDRHVDIVPVVNVNGAVTVTYTMTANMPGRLCYKSVGGSPSYTNPELSSTYGTPGNPHVQTLNGLGPGLYEVYSQTTTDGGLTWEDLSCPEKFTIQQVLNNKVFFFEIEDAAPDHMCFDRPSHYLAEYLRQNPGVCFWDLDEAQECITPLPIPEVTGPTVTISSTGGNDTALIVNAFNSVGSGGCVDGQGQTYRVQNATTTASNVRLKNVNLIPNGTGGNHLIRINGDDVFFENVHVDGQNQNYTDGIYINDNADRPIIVNSSVRNIDIPLADQVTHSLLRIRAVEQPHIACNVLENIFAPGCRGIRFGHASDQTVTNGGYVVNNTFGRMRSKGLQTGGTECDCIYAAAQRGPDDGWINEPLRVLANRSTNSGRRFIKGQASNIEAFSNVNEWSGNEGQPQPRLAMYSSQGWNTHFYQNNHIIFNHTDSWRARAFIFTPAVNRGTTMDYTDCHFDCNRLTTNTNPGATQDGFIDIAQTQANSLAGPWGVNCSIDNNVIDGAGSIDYVYWFRGSADQSNNWIPTSGPTTNGNTWSVPINNAVHR